MSGSHRKKTFGFILVMLLTVAIAGYLYLFRLPYFAIAEKDRTDIIHSIKSAPGLPERFYEVYGLIYPEALEQSQFQYLIRKEFGNIYRKSECPCRLATYYSHLTSRYRISLPQMTFFVEDFVTPKECLNFYAGRIFFGEGITGVSSASENLFNKALADLEDKEYAELIIIMENPSYYNRARRPEAIQGRINSIYGMN